MSGKTIPALAAAILLGSATITAAQTGAPSAQGSAGAGGTLMDFYGYNGPYGYEFGMPAPGAYGYGYGQEYGYGPPYPDRDLLNHGR